MGGCAYSPPPINQLFVETVGRGDTRRHCSRIEFQSERGGAGNSRLFAKYANEVLMVQDIHIGPI